MILYTMDVNTIENDKLAAYQLKDLAQTWYTEWRDTRSLRGGPVTWEIFKRSFIDRLIPRELKDDKVEELINVRQVGMCVTLVFL